MADRPRREKQDKLSKLAELKRVREGGKREYQERESVVYDEVTEEQYRGVVKGRLARDDFVVDDGAEGYVDNGLDDWGQEDHYTSEDDEPTKRRSKKAGASKTNSNSKTKSQYSDYVKSKPKAPPPAEATSSSFSAYHQARSTDEEADFMSNLLGEASAVAHTAAAPARKSRKRKDKYQLSDEESGRPFPSSSRTYPQRYRDNADSSSDGFELMDAGGVASSGDDVDWAASPRKKARTTGNMTNMPPIASLQVKSDHEDGDVDYDASFDTAFDDIDMEALTDAELPSATTSKLNNGAARVKKEELDNVGLPPKPKSLKPTNGVKKEEGPPSWLSTYDSLAVAKTEDEGIGSSSKSTGAPSATPTATSGSVDALEPDGSLRFFWIDYLELDGKIYFIGKVKDKKSGAWASCCITVENLERNLFVLPRERKVEEVMVGDSSDEESEEEEPVKDEDEEDDEGEKEERKKASAKRKVKRRRELKMVETDDIPEMVDVYQDFDQVRRKAGIKKFKAKFVDRLYAFGEKDVPREKQKWLKVVYGFDEPQIPSNVSSPNFLRVFGTNTSAFELLVLKRKIMGPCWLQIKSPVVEHKGVSWCKFEASVADPKDINPFSETDATAPKETPPLTVMSLTLRTIVNHRENKREIVCATARIWANLDIDDPRPPQELPCTVHTFVRPLDRFPPNFENTARANGRGVISPQRNERMLLQSLLQTIYKADPDVLVGHEFLGVSLDVLLNRMRELKTDHWSRIGRFRRSKWPNIGRQGTNIKFLNGRMLCDLASDGAKGMISSTTWSLSEMVATHLKMERQDIDPDDTTTFFDPTVSSPDSLMNFVRHCELDAHFQMAIASKVQIMPLTKQLTNLAGNSWNKTLNGGRAERNEYILLHEFHKLKYICPDKSWGRKFKPEPTPGEEAEGSKTKGKRDKYKGGLVFDPKRGLYDKFILVMDFNSLYPSIIQEYNIDFTTVNQIEDELQEGEEEQMPEPPPAGVKQGVLPRLIATLVARRREVKKLMKDKSATGTQLQAWDIKQLALKLTANSMYGCLGFEGSRFYARPLAALTTFKGREILTQTKELAESLNLEVVYGDTDSVFVNSNVTELSEALKISNELKKAVNDRYKLLEIDLDGVFQRLLLLQKKKYAAIKVEDGTRTSVEVKGLDMKRREYCNLSKTVSQYVLEQILSGEMTEIVVERIHEYLGTISENVKNGTIKLEEFIINKRLGKNPEEYPDAKSQPHVQVALRTKAKGGTSKAGDVISYVFCTPETADVKGPAPKAAQADCAKSPDEVRKAEGELKIDYDFYLSHQVLPPIERLCEPIEGTDRARLAECLGLDPNRYRTSAGEGQERAFSTLDSTKSDAERFRECEPFLVRCRACEGTVVFSPIHDRENSCILPSGPTCPACGKPLLTPSLVVQLEVQIRAFIGRYYEAWMSCNDQTCELRTRMMSVYGRRCLRPECPGTASFEYTDLMLYNQLLYFASLFDHEKIKTRSVGGGKDGDINAIVDTNIIFLTEMSAAVSKYVDQSGRRWVELGSLFSFMKI